MASIQLVVLSILPLLMVIYYNVKICLTIKNRYDMMLPNRVMFFSVESHSSSNGSTTSRNSCSDIITVSPSKLNRGSMIVHHLINGELKGSLTQNIRAKEDKLALINAVSIFDTIFKLY